MLARNDQSLGFSHVLEAIQWAALAKGSSDGRLSPWARDPDNDGGFETVDRIGTQSQQLRAVGVHADGGAPTF